MLKSSFHLVFPSQEEAARQREQEMAERLAGAAEKRKLREEAEWERQERERMEQEEREQEEEEEKRRQEEEEEKIREKEREVGIKQTFFLSLRVSYSS